MSGLGSETTRNIVETKARGQKGLFTDHQRNYIQNNFMDEWLTVATSEGAKKATLLQWKKDAADQILKSPLFTEGGLDERRDLDAWKEVS